MSNINLLKTIDSNIGDSLLNDSGYLKEVGTAKRVDQKKLEEFALMINEFIKDSSTIDAYTIAESIAKKTGWRKALTPSENSIKTPPPVARNN